MLSSSVRLTGGIARGRVLKERVPPGVRPTSSRVREALFSIVGQDLTGVRLLDAFGGAGLVGLEAWSRGANVVVFEKDKRAFDALVRRGAEVGATWTTVRGDVLRAAHEPYEGVFVDPPYAEDPAPIVATLGDLATRWLVLEADEHTAVPDRAGSLPLERSRKYGQTVLHVYRETE